MKPFAEKALVLVIGAIFLFPLNAFAYLDPGSGSMLLQLILGGFAGLVIVFKLYWQSFLSFFKGKKSTDSVSTDKKEP